MCILQDPIPIELKVEMTALNISLITRVYPDPLYLDSSTHVERVPDDVWPMGCQLGITGGGRNTGTGGGLI